MATIAAFFLFSTLLQSLFASVPPPCVFPFIYNGKSYRSCTEDASQNRPWCATVANYDQYKKWKYCATKEYGGNSGGKQCTFPFTYKKRTYYACTNEDAEIGRFWCATTGSYDKEKQWSYCADTRLAANSQGPCVFPFIYKGQPYYACTKAGSSDGKLWCSLSSNYDREPKWTYCTPSELGPCKFPFRFNNKYYYRCTREGASDSLLWCAITANYDKDSKWRACATEEYEGNSKGKRCVFPFIYNGKRFNSCTNQNSQDGRFWCSVTSNYDKDRQWSYCADTRL
ncbi:epididymal sperm-binding protein 1-like [Pseudonaja textilis]|uniref:epididymal sperm-binding protein 1-like n=1 Tax=Pseudonaja textilis TaxID=8673 RepID=UPI000EA84495|nr:epididymal sperm-binding protein 1-like [Pseudonaja textilis]